MRISLRSVGIGAFSLVGIISGAGAFLIVSDRLDQPATPDPASLIAKARRYAVRIARDTFGVPHVIGPRDIDVAFGFGFAHAEDDFTTIQQVALAVRGQLAAVEGPKAAVSDYLVRLFRVWETVNAKYESDLPPDVRQVLEAYADGVNYYAALHPDKVARGMLPLTGKDVVAGFVFKMPFFYGLDKVLLRLTSPESGGGISRDGKDAFLRTDAPLPVGSNAVAVGPSRSADGATRLLVNSHQPYTGPVAWYEAVLDSGEGWAIHALRTHFGRLDPEWGEGKPPASRHTRSGYRWRPGYLSRRLRREATGRHFDRASRRHVHHVRDLGQRGQPH